MGWSASLSVCMAVRYLCRYHIIEVDASAIKTSFRHLYYKKEKTQQSRLTPCYPNSSPKNSKQEF